MTAYVLFNMHSEFWFCYIVYLLWVWISHIPYEVVVIIIIIINDYIKISIEMLIILSFITLAIYVESNGLFLFISNSRNKRLSAWHVCLWLQIICAKLPHVQLIHFLDSLLDGLLDAEPCSSSGASVVLNALLKCNGRELYHQVNDILCKTILNGWNINLVVYVIVNVS
jgi:hypothetical protein